MLFARALPSLLPTPPPIGDDRISMHYKVQEAMPPQESAEMGSTGPTPILAIRVFWHLEEDSDRLIMVAFLPH